MSEEKHRERRSEYYFELGIRELDSGNIEQAIRAFEQAIALDPDDFRFFSNLGIAYGLLRDYEKARTAYERAIELKADSPGALNNLAGLLSREGDAESAGKLYDSAICSDPLYIEPYLNITRMLVEMRKFADAEPYLRGVLALEPGNAEALNLLGVITSVTERPEEAIRLFQKVLRSDPDQSTVFSNLGAALRNIGDKRRAILAFEKSYELNPNSLSILNNLGLLYRESGNPEKAKSFFRRAMEFYPENPFPYFNMAELHIETREYSKALNYLKRYLTLVPLDMDTLYKTCGIARMAERLQDIIPEMERFIDQADEQDERKPMVSYWLSSVAR